MKRITKAQLDQFEEQFSKDLETDPEFLKIQGSDVDETLHTAYRYVFTKYNTELAKYKETLK